MNQGLVEGFERWRDHVAEEKQMKAKALKVVQRLMNRGLVEGFERWRDHVAEEKQMKAKALKVVHRLLKSALVVCFDKWTVRLADNVRIRAVLSKVLTQMMNHTLSVAFCSWKEQAVRVRRLIAYEQSAWRRTLSFAFCTWHAQKMALTLLRTWKSSFLSSRLFNHSIPSLIFCFHRWFLFVVQCKHISKSAHERCRHKLRYIYREGALHCGHRGLRGRGTVLGRDGGGMVRLQIHLFCFTSSCSRMRARDVPHQV